jgi:hypothetical protein
LIGAAALLGGLAACTPPGTGGGGGPTTTIATTTTVPAGCTDTPTPVIGGYPLAVPASGWYSSDTREHGNVRVDDSLPALAGFGCNSVRLATGASTPSPSQDKAQLFSYDLAGTSITALNTISYHAYRSALPVNSNPATVALNVQVIGASVGGNNFATLVYEPYNQSTGNAGVLDNLGTWQTWDATSTAPDDGVWWSSKIGSGPGSQGDPQPWAWFQTTYADAVVAGYGFNLGSNNPNLVVGADGLTINTTTTDF